MFDVEEPSVLLVGLQVVEDIHEVGEALDVARGHLLAVDEVREGARESDCRGF